MFVNQIKRETADGGTVLGVALPEPSELMARLSIDCGIDFLWIDLEHRPYGTQEVCRVPMMCRAADCASIVRVPGLDSIWIKKALDIGANTIMVPQINNADEAKRAVEYCKYPPEGSRGISPWWTQHMGVEWSDYLPVANDETGVILQIETPEGVENLDAICQVDGVDVVFAGPADLSASLGIIGQFQHPKLQELLADFPKRVAGHGKPAGITFNALAPAATALENGYRLINIGTLYHHGIEGLKSALADLRTK